MTEGSVLTHHAELPWQLLEEEGGEEGPPWTRPHLSG